MELSDRRHNGVERIDGAEVRVAAVVRDAVKQTVWTLNRAGPRPTRQEPVFERRQVRQHRDRKIESVRNALVTGRTPAPEIESGVRDGEPSYRIGEDQTCQPGADAVGIANLETQNVADVRGESDRGTHIRRIGSGDSVAMEKVAIQVNVERVVNMERDGSVDRTREHIGLSRGDVHDVRSDRTGDDANDGEFLLHGLPPGAAFVRGGRSDRNVSAN